MNTIRIIDLTQEPADIAHDLSELVRNGEVVALHAPWDSETANVYHDEEELPHVSMDDLIVLAFRRGRSDAEVAAELVSKFEEAL